MPRETGPLQYREGDPRTNIELLTSHAKVLLCILDNPTISGVMMAKRLGTTDRTVRQVIRELKATGIVEVEGKIRGRGVIYKVNPNTSLFSPGIGSLEVGKFAKAMDLIAEDPAKA